MVPHLSKNYFDEPLVDIVHAATCLQENSILITNDKHFDKISRNKIIEVWSINRAVENLL